MDKIKNLRPLLLEFIRYCVVGGAAFLVDAGILALFNQVILPELGGYRLYIATAIGFLAGLVFNYIFSLLFVFSAAKNGRVGRSVGAFAIFAVVGGIGLGLTELGMYIGVSRLGLHYMLVKVVVTAVVLMWNYLGRKILIFK
ncbi:Putative flippase GtrA (transmembrane translocase of bactoprenol-linked glucose) [Sporobacter termitidis DSM 10068]|uniref:Putative flippase GtrA (Transmembrane translocase of bactoprenol-linked glucose) n=1 Tax=Sporobacter termitidis DSM 10068 TaxID=1123282 RepID=A0A1M5WTM9_9FIRM|nr:GtrA family protein [Sporobacter termitidis]SHH90907.1 Putative flippase GtrA (transmembrane translocase of bactoprenol-linked glucose) [Sporobacter termitidis DSM 10068]